MRHYTPDEIGLICSLADLAAVAIEKTGLLQQTQEQVAELELDGFRARSSLARLEQLAEAYGRIMSLLVAGADLTTVAKAAGDALDGTLQMRDPAGRVLAAGGEIPDLDEEAVARAVLATHARRGPVQADDHTWVAPVTAGTEDLGVVVLRPVAQLVGQDSSLLQTTAQAFAVHLLMQRSAAAAEGPVRDDLLDELLAVSSSAHPPHQTAQRARRLDVDLDQPHVLVVARPEGGEQGRAVVWASSYAYRMSGLKTVQGGCIVLLLPGTDASAAARAVVGELTPLLGHPVSVGAAGPDWGAASVARMHREALRCLDALTALDGVGCAASAQDLGFLGLLLSDDYDVDDFIDLAIGPVLAYDAERLTDLTRTLEAYFASGGSPTNAAEALHVHPNTVSRRVGEDHRTARHRLAEAGPGTGGASGAAAAADPGGAAGARRVPGGGRGQVRGPARPEIIFRWLVPTASRQPRSVYLTNNPGEFRNVPHRAPRLEERGEQRSPSHGQLTEREREPSEHHRNQRSPGSGHPPGGRAAPSHRGHPHGDTRRRALPRGRTRSRATATTGTWPPPRRSACRPPPNRSSRSSGRRSATASASPSAAAGTASRTSSSTTRRRSSSICG
ncbi:hypothetical protein SFUMM280S_05520 [Streptomyces fumanus]